MKRKKIKISLKHKKKVNLVLSRTYVKMHMSEFMTVGDFIRKLFWHRMNIILLSRVPFCISHEISTHAIVVCVNFG